MDSIIFDLDGTLWDSMDTVLTAWNSITKEHPQVEREFNREEFSFTMGLQIEEIGERLFPALSAVERKTLLKECCDLESEYLGNQGGDLYENIEKVLEVLSNKYKLFIVSNCQDGYIEAFYKYHGLEKFFVDYENPGRTGLSKGENIKLIMERNNLSSPVYVGDTEGDLQGAKYAGIPFVYAQYGFGEAKEYDFSIEKFEDLIELFG
ncbi:HAD family hydrolase [Rossellomorea vietnamensis]|uniref:HAD family hydrolase n=1 Tax=Rossellomorea vietnamensis TaxID=218284 RepID=A0A5D4MFL2_9BACI|nr:HAD family hydrolase [Rossellomorea vietnamensis]TYS00670.1 HAD family hydrolase [Rossellomorea vietnamensis]